MSDIAIQVENLSKRYRIGLKEKLPDTFGGAIASWIKSPISNFKTLRNLSKFDENGHAEDVLWALKDVSFDVKHGEVIGIIGRNGAGKSTLLKIISRITRPTSGRAILNGRVASLLEVGTGFHMDLTGRENIYLNATLLGMSKQEVDRKFDEIVSFSGVEKFIDTPVKRYSSGMKVRLAFAVAAHLEPEIMLVDEVLAVGDAAFQKKCLGKIGDVVREGRTVLFVSHNMGAVQDLCMRAVLLENGAIAKAGTVEETIKHYLKEAASNKIVFNNQPIKTASIRQLGNEIELVVEYEVDRRLTLPNLGFVISDYLGNPICGTNPKIERLEDRILPSSKGTIRVTLLYPKLLNGTYRVSLWFGDGVRDFFSAKDCLTFEVVNMTDSRQLYSSTSIGPVSPRCNWIFDGDQK